MNCPSCNTPLRPGASFCSGCGNPVRREERCPECNATLVPGDAFCSNCGAAILSSGEPSSTPSQYRVPSQQNSKSVPSGYVGQSMSSNLTPPRKKVSQYYSATVKCEVTEENRNIIKKVFLRSFMNDSDLIEDNGVFIVLKKKDEGVFRISIDPLPGAKGYSIQIQADTTSIGGITMFYVFLVVGLVLTSAGIEIPTLLCIGVPIIILSFICLGIQLSLEGTTKKKLKRALNQVVSFFN